MTSMSIPPPHGVPGPPDSGGDAQPHPRGTLVLVLGIVGLLCIGILGPVAAVLGKQALDEIDRNPTAYTNRGQVQAGMILGIIATIVWVIGLVIAIG